MSNTAQHQDEKANEPGTEAGAPALPVAASIAAGAAHNSQAQRDGAKADFDTAKGGPVGSAGQVGDLKTTGTAEPEAPQSIDARAPGLFTRLGRWFWTDLEGNA